jgi:hypothetical protein
MIKHALKKIPLIMNAYLTWMLFRRMSVGDIFDLKKLVLFWKAAPYTMTNYNRLSQIYQLAGMFENKKTGGAFVECGAWRGGSAGVMAHVAKKAGSGRHTWVFDLFEAVDKGPEKVPAFYKEKTSVDYAYHLLFSKLGLDKAYVHVRKGWFKDTIPEARGEIGDIALLRLDCDLYESNMLCLNNLYDQVIKGGYVIINTYDSWEGTKRAVDDFLKSRGMAVELKKIDYGGRYFQKI